MQKIFTSKQAVQAKTLPSPSPKTIAFIRQFARANYPTGTTLMGNTVIVLN